MTGTSLIGQQFGAFQVTALLGADGMGEVYRARDTKLGREVALKIMSSALARDPDRLVRFEREARLLAALNHPNIATIFGVEEAEGASAIVMELVEGDTLATALKSGRLMPLDQVLAIARQLVDALGAAHQRGIVHRDLKPANIAVARGRVKVLDFGLARIADVGGDGSPDSPTITAELTRTGVIVGTPAYMSLEQARGEAVDTRTDIWALGCILFELLTARPAFAARTISDTIAAVLEREPDWQRLPSATPAALHRLLRRCLRKDAAQRLQDVRDAHFELEEASSPVGVNTPTERQAGRPRVFLWIAAAAAVLAIGLASPLLRSRLADRAASALAVGPMTRITSDVGLTTTPSINADGRFIAYASDRGGQRKSGHLASTNLRRPHATVDRRSL